MSKKLSIILAATMVFSPLVEAASFGRSGGFSRSSSSRSFSSPSKTPSTPSQNTAKSPGGIGGTSGSIGVKKPDITQAARSTPSPAPTPSYNSGYRPNTVPPPSYGYSTPPAPQVSNTSTFMSSLGGSFVGSALGNMIFGGNHGSSGGTTVINNGVAPAAGSAAPSASVANGMTPIDGSIQHAPVTISAKKYGVMDFIIDVLMFMLLIGFLVMIAYAGKKMFDYIKNRVKTNREISNAPILNRGEMFWEVQQAFAEADLTKLNTLVGPDIMAELSRSKLEPSVVSIKQLSYETIHDTGLEKSVSYEFMDDAAGNQVIDQVWHYELLNGSWKVVGIENV
jgi:hypothetical protein